MATSVPMSSVPTKLINIKTRNICFTINNYTSVEVENLRKHSDEYKYLVFGYETAPETGTPHLQAFVVFNNPRSMLAFQKEISPTIKFHMEVMRGTHKQASDYCKEDGIYEEYGELPTPGVRTDWEKAKKDITEKAVVDVIDAQPHLMPCIKALERYKTLSLRPKHRPNLTVIILWGDAGCGKSKWAWDNYGDNLYSKPTGDWWDGYSGESTILLDDYYGGIQYSEFLKVLDIYPYQVPVKGGFIQAQWTTVIITSNKPPEQWYKVGMTPALRRRIKNIYYMYSKDGISQKEDYESPAQIQ